MSDVVSIRLAYELDAIPKVRRLLRQYQASIGSDLCFQDFETELATLPGCYKLPRGRLLLAEKDSVAVGCGAFRPRDPTTCEMKRLFVVEEFRSLRIGRTIAEALIREARAEGYERMVLDSLPTMVAAQRLYESLGFIDIEPYTSNPIEGTRFMGRAL